MPGTSVPAESDEGADRSRPSCCWAAWPEWSKFSLDYVRTPALVNFVSRCPAQCLICVIPRLQMLLLHTTSPSRAQIQRIRECLRATPTNRLLATILPTITPIVRKGAQVFDSRDGIAIRISIGIWCVTSIARSYTMRTGAFLSYVIFGAQRLKQIRKSRYSRQCVRLPG